MDLYTDLQNTIHLLNEAIKQYPKRGAAFAKAEQDYKVALAQEILKERDNKIPVTIISDICRGKPDIAKLRFKRDVAEALYKSAAEAINGYKLQIRLLDNQIEREWGNSK